MEKEMPGEIVINAPAEVVWDVLGRRFGAISDWASIISSSESIANPDAQIQAPFSGRICRAYGFGKVQENLLEYDAPNMRFRYEAITGLPFFIQYAENNWSVEPLSENQSIVRSKGVLRMGPFAGTLLFPLFNFLMKQMGQRLYKDLKKYVEKRYAQSFDS